MFLQYIHCYQGFKSLIHRFFCLQTSHLLCPLSTDLSLLTSFTFIVLPFFTVTVLIVFIAYAKSSLYFYFDIFIIAEI